MKFIVIVAFFLACANLLYLDWHFFFAPKSQEAPQTSQQKPLSPIAQSDQFCSQGCLSAITQATVSAALVTPTQTPVSSTTTVATSAVKEYFIPLGSASFTSTTMAPVPGLSASVDTANYPNIQQVLFEVSVSVPTGNETVSVNLYNQTMQHPVWFSDVSFNGGTNGQLLISQPITLDPGNNVYQVQMQTQLTYPANIEQARLHIFLN